MTAVQGLVTCHVRTVHELLTWHRFELARDVSASEVQRMHVPVHADYSAVNHVVYRTLQHVTSPQQCMEVLKRWSGALVHNTWLTRALTRVQWSAALHNRAKYTLLHALLRTPGDTDLWLEYLLIC